MNLVKNKLPMWKLIVLILVLSAVSVVVGYSAYTIYKAKTTKFEAQVYKEKINKESQGTWGVLPREGCSVFEGVGLMNLGYIKDENSSENYTCKSPLVEIPSNNGKKTLQYQASGYPDKATKFKLVLTIDGDQENKEAVSARKTWAIYGSVLYTNLFGTLGEFTESQMQQLADLKPDSEISYYVEGKLLISANVIVKDGTGVYTFDISGMPNLKFN